MIFPNSLIFEEEQPYNALDIYRNRSTFVQNVQTAFSVVVISCNENREDYKQKRVLQTDSYV